MSDNNINLQDFLESIDIVSFKTQLEELSSKLTQIDISTENSEYVSTIKKINKISEIVDTYNEVQKNLKEIEEAKLLLQDPEMKEMAQIELDNLLVKSESSTNKLIQFTQKPLPNDEAKAIVEIRPGVGGVEASLFAEELFRMYLRYCNNKHLHVEQISLDYDSEGGIKESIFLVNTSDAFSLLRFESGVHRVQRVPVTESSGRIHTSSASVVIMPQFENINVDIKQEDLRIEVFRAGGPGGQSVNTTDSAVRITHIPTKISVSCQNGKSQHKNKEMAMSILASKLEEIEREKLSSKEKNIRESSIKGGDRSVKIRTYNFPQGRVTDHRIKKTWYNLDQILNGEADEVIETVNSILRKENLNQEVSDLDED